MKKIIAVMIAAVCVFSLFSTAVYAQYPCQVQVYGTDKEGLAMKASPDVNASRYQVIPENASLSIDQVNGGWGHTSYNGQTGWVALEYTRIQGGYTSLAPSYGYITPTTYTVRGTDGEGLELRVDPSIQCSTFGPIPEGASVVVTAIINDWGYTFYNGHYGYANLTYLTKWAPPSTPTANNYYVMVYATDREGLALKAAADINSARYMLIPEDVILNIDSVSQNGWGHTNYNGYSGWVALRYTRVMGGYPTAAPAGGWITPKNYTVYNTEGEGLEMRILPTVEASTFGPVPEGTVLQVQAINGDWAYTTYGGNAGWCNLAHLR